MVARDLPPISEQTVFCDMTEEQFKVYDEEKSSVRNSILKNMESSRREKSAIIVLQGLMKLTTDLKSSRYGERRIFVQLR